MNFQVRDSALWIIREDTPRRQFESASGYFTTTYPRNCVKNNIRNHDQLGIMSERKFKNTFAPHVTNKEFTIKQIRGLIKLSAIRIDSLPNDILQALEDNPRKFD